jgi:uncharacterized protein YaeQ
MAQTATIYTVETEIADVDRAVYQTETIRLARQPSETAEYMLMRFLAYCLEHREGIAFTEGVAAGDEPAVLVRDLTGRLTAWIEVGMPTAERVHRGSKRAARVAVYTHRAVGQVLAQLGGQQVYRAPEIPVYAFAGAFVEPAAAALQRRSKVVLSVNERQIFLDVDGQGFDSTIAEHRFS